MSTIKRCVEDYTHYLVSLLVMGIITETEKDEAAEQYEKDLHWLLETTTQDRGVGQ